MASKNFISKRIAEEYTKNLIIPSRPNDLIGY